MRTSAYTRCSLTTGLREPHTHGATAAYMKPSMTTPAMAASRVPIPSRNASPMPSRPSMNSQSIAGTARDSKKEARGLPVVAPVR